MVCEGDVEGGLVRMRAGQEAWRATGARLGLPSYIGRLAESLLIAGQLDAAAAAARRKRSSPAMGNATTKPSCTACTARSSGGRKAMLPAQSPM